MPGARRASTVAALSVLAVAVVLISSAGGPLSTGRTLPAFRAPLGARGGSAIGSASGSPDAVGGLTVLGAPNVGRTPYLATWNATGGAGSGDVYVANVGSGNVSILSGSSTVGTVNVSTQGLGPYDPIDDPASPSILLTYHSYGLHGSAHNVSVLHGPVVHGTQAVGNVTGITPADEPALGVYDLTTGDVCFSDLGTTVGVAIVNASSLSRFTTVPTGLASEPRDLVVDPPTGWVYVADLGNSTIGIVSGKLLLASVPVPALFNTTHTLLNATGEVFVPDYTSDLAYDPLNGDVYVADAGAGKVSVLNGTRILANVSVGELPYSVAYDPNDGDVYVTNVFSDTVSILSGTSVLGTVTVGRLPIDATYDAYDGDLLVANLNSSNISVLSGRTVLGSVAVGTDPVYQVYDTINGDAYVVNQGSDNVTVLGATSSGGGSGIPPWGWGLILVLIVLLLLILLVLLRRRRKRRDASPAAPPSPTAPPGEPAVPAPPAPPGTS